jgi:gamma-glutamylputrescine oxidase
MNPLHLNDRPGEFPPSWYAASCPPPPAARPALEGEVTADVCIVGGGYTGLSAALTLREHGLDVVLLEAHRIGWGASGRNGGQVGSGYNKGQIWLEKRVGKETARALWDLAEEAKALTAERAAEFAPNARLLPGVAQGEYSADELASVRAEAEHLSRVYGYDKITVMEREEYAALVKSPLYRGGMLDRGAGHIHPLRYVLGIGAGAEAAGVRIYETSEVTGLTHGDTATVATAKGRVRAKHVLLAGNGYLPIFEPRVSRRVMPINSFIIATEPLGERVRDVLAEDIAACDSSHVVNYFRMSEDGRLLFGGRSAYSIKFPATIGKTIHRRMGEMFPQIADARVDYAWGGTLGITLTKLPNIRRIAPNVLTASGYAGHGVALASIAGKVAGEAIAGQASRFDTLSALPVPRLPFGTYFQTQTMALAMAWYALRDKLGV